MEDEQMKEKEPSVRWFNLRGDKEALADVRQTIAEIKKLLPKAEKMYLDVPENARSIEVVRASVHLYLDLLQSAIKDTENTPKKSLSLWAKKK